METFSKEYFQKINNRQTFEEFIKMLETDYNLNRQEWKNQDLSSFLEAIHAWLVDSPQTDFQFSFGETTWPFLALLLYMGKIYE